MVKYTPRERVLKILDHEEADRVPADFGALYSKPMKQAYFKLKHFLHLPISFDEIDFWPRPASYTSSYKPASIDEAIYKKFQIDFRPIKLKSKSIPYVPKMVYPDGSYINNFGYHKIGGDIYLENARPYALEYAETVEEIEEDPYWIDPENDLSVDGLRKQAERIERDDYALIFPSSSGIYEMADNRRGFETFIKDLYFRPKIAKAIIDRVLKIQLAMYGMLLDEIGDLLTVVGTGDDISGQTTPLLNPKIYRKYIKPAEKKLIDLIHRKTDAKVFFHSCGYVIPFIEDFIDIGVDILHPVQPECPGQDLRMLKERWGDKLTFCGGIGTQHILPRGSISEVEAEVKRCIDAAARGGGYIAAPAQNIQPDVPPWNICAMYDAVLKYGNYPITL